MKTEKNVKPLREGTRKNNQEKPNSTIQKSYVIKPPAATKNK
jgi:hypothetical protein